jgi:mercuric ion transport protein
MNNRKLLGLGMGGTIIAAICCFTPALVILLGAVGLSAWLGWLDYVLLPALIIFLGITAVAAIRLVRKSCSGENIKETS